ncbi:TIGR02186 family protein [Palleronia sp.]|uniref:TIGR02186 family protein n=1 Tax=Palleronia sp. TaxID=1940284 RepID=UPI0035C875CD
MYRLILVLMLLALPASAQEIVAGLSQNRISISANFDGSEILIFGAVKDSNVPIDEESGVIVTIEGPKAPLTVRRKDRLGAIWVNRTSVEIDEAPSFYAVNTSGPLERILDYTENLRHEITVSEAIRSVGAPPEVTDSLAFTDALVRIREGSGLYQTNIGAVTVREATLFNTSFILPANLLEGVYTARLFLTSGGEVVSEASQTIYVEKVGLERFLYSLAHEQPLAYGFLSLAIAIAAGWGASAVFRYIQS